MQLPRIPTWLKPVAAGAAGGAVVCAIVGFSWLGWMTAPDAQKMAEEMSQDKFVAAMTPVCVAQANRDPNQQVKMAKIQDASSYKRDDALMEAGWATMPGTSAPDQQIARACLQALQDAA